uniref:Uncharacterized protein n=1 Tax=Lepeophtheirus salmonis TaxID=72036 RepID=A0A0K2TFZ5_LEPSM
MSGEEGAHKSCFPKSEKLSTSHCDDSQHYCRGRKLSLIDWQNLINRVPIVSRLVNGPIFSCLVVMLGENQILWFLASISIMNEPILVNCSSFER